VVIAKPNAFIKFYGIKCLGIVDGNDFALIGKNKFTQWFLNAYVEVIGFFIFLCDIFLTIMGIDHTAGFVIDYYPAKIMTLEEFIKEVEDET
jgi:hypothetical protein